MSNSVEHVDVIHSKGFGLKLETYNKLRAKYEDNGELPESTFLEESNLKHCFKVKDDFLEVLLLWWHGEGSERSVDLLIKKILPQFDGEADVVFSYENGGQEGYRLKNHVVVQHEVIVALGEPLTT